MMIPFTGETVVCIFCLDVLQSSLTASSNWRCVEVGEPACGRLRFYACTKHFPPDTASEDEFKAAYLSFFKRALAAKMGKN